VLVPDVREMGAADADQALRDAGLVPKAIGATGASDAWVLSQTPSAGSLVSLGSTVVINLTDAYRP
jgi:beta-lactam-binding protein with PASTA domain